MKLAVFSIGTPVKVGPCDDKILAAVVAVCIRGEAHQVQYECAWWDGKTRTTAWLDEGEVIPSDEKPIKVTIGYAGVDKCDEARRAK